MKEEAKEFLEIVGGVIGIGILILGILALNLSDALKYSIILGLFLILKDCN